MNKDTTLEEACGNGDGTYNGFKLMRFLVDAVSRHPMTDKEADDLWKETLKRVEEAKRKRNEHI